MKNVHLLDGVVPFIIKDLGMIIVSNSLLMLVLLIQLHQK